MDLRFFNVEIEKRTYAVATGETIYPSLATERPRRLT